jgi:membrane-associated protease RseP (regulator of RpoE activity)
MRKLWLILAIAVVVGMLIPVAVVFGGPDEDRHEDRRVVIFRSGGPRLGIEIDDLTADRAKELGLKEEAGVEIEAVVPDSPAEKAGLKKGDVVTRYQETRVDSAMQLRRLVRETPAGRTVTLQVFRDGASRNVSVKLAEMEEDGREIIRRHHIEIPPIDIPDIEIPDIPHFGMLAGHVRLGAEVESLGEQLAEFFGVKSGGGVLVRSVMKGGPGEAAGLKAGDVIVRVDGEAVTDHGDLRTALRDRRGKELKLGIVRDKREMALTVAAPKEGEGDPAKFQWIEGDFDVETIEDGVEEGIEGALRGTHAAIEKEVRKIKLDKDKIKAEALKATEELEALQESDDAI